MKNRGEHSPFDAAVRVLAIAASTLAGSAVSAQTQQFVPVAISGRMEAGSNQVAVSWSSVPGRTYQLVTRDGLESPWVATNVPPIKAASSSVTVAHGLQDPEIPVRFYQVLAQPVPPGNTNPITSSVIAEMEKALGLTFTASQRSQVASGLTSRRASYEAMRRVPLLNSDDSAFVFDPRPAGFVMPVDQKPITWSAPARTTVPANRNELAFYTVRELAALIRTGQTTASELTQLYLQRIKRHDSRLKSVITVTEELALEQAARADAEIAAGQYRGLLHGIPYGVKDLIAKRGYPTTWGAAQFKDQVLDADATVVRRLEEAGAVLVAKLSTGELAVGEDWFGGKTRNPWNLAEGSGGSSAGPAAATAAGLVAFSIGTETYGSIVLPSARCRVTGLRPTFGRVSRTGVMTACWSMDKVGPICRDVEDCATVLEAIRGADGSDRAAVDAPFNYTPALDLKKLRVGYKRTLGRAVLDRLAALVGPEQLIPVVLPTTRVDVFLVFEVELAAAFDEMVRLRADNYLLPDSLWRSELPLGQAISAVEYLQANRHRMKLLEDLAQLMDQIDVYVTDYADLFDTGNGAARALFNLSGHPCVSIPHGGSDICLAFVGELYDESTILALAKACQDATSYHTGRPPGFVD